jgi:hypothetical protein
MDTDTVQFSNHATAKVRLSESTLWTFQKEFYSQEGVEAWAQKIPFFSTSNVFIAHSYAAILIRFMQDWTEHHSAEADDRLVDQLYLQYLGRPADPGGEAFWAGLLQAGHTEEDVIARLLSSNEFFNRAPTLATTAGDPNADFISALYESLLDRAPSAGDISAWESVLATSGRAGVVNGITHSNEFRSDQVASFYVTFLHRSGSEKEIASWVGSNLDLLSIEVGFCGSQEFFANG